MTDATDMEQRIATIAESADAIAKALEALPKTAQSVLALDCVGIINDQLRWLRSAVNLLKERVVSK